MDESCPDAAEEEDDGQRWLRVHQLVLGLHLWDVILARAFVARAFEMESFQIERVNELLLQRRQELEAAIRREGQNLNVSFDDLLLNATMSEGLIPRFSLCIVPSFAGESADAADRSLLERLEAQNRAWMHWNVCAVLASQRRLEKVVRVVDRMMPLQRGRENTELVTRMCSPKYVTELVGMASAAAAKQ